MKHLRTLLVLTALAACAVCWAADTPAADPLRDYVYAPDPSYTYSLHTVVEEDGYKACFIEMTSQSWRADDVEPHLWRHWLTVILPDNVNGTRAMLYVSGGHTSPDPPVAAPPLFARIAMITQSVVVVLRNVPCQPLVFDGVGEEFREDEIIAFSFAKFVETGDPTWPALCAMVKSAVRAMDTVQDFCVKELTPPVRVNGFVVTGESKRGWTSWLTGAIDPRVVAIAPMVFDMLNMPAQLEHQRKCYAGYSGEIDDYTNRGLQDLLDTPEGQALRQIVDPYLYLDRLMLPKLVLLGAGDEYWTVDAARFYFPDLLGEKCLRYEPNADHGQFDNPGPQRSLMAFYGHVLADKPMPRFTWKIDPKKGKFEIRAKDDPSLVRVWEAQSDSLDFRRETIGDVWASQVIPAKKRGVYKGRVLAPDTGHLAFYFELVYPSGLGFDYSLTTTMTIRE